MYCLRCGRANMEGRETCQNCGAKLGEEVTYAPAKEKDSKRKHIGLLVTSIVFVVLVSVDLILSLFTGPTFHGVSIHVALIYAGIQGITQNRNIKKIKIGYFVVAVIQALYLGVLYKICVLNKIDDVISVSMFVGPVIMLVMGLFAASAEKMNDNLFVPVNKNTLIIVAAIAGCISFLSEILYKSRWLFVFKLKHLWFGIGLDTILAIIFIGCVTIIKKLTMKESLILGIAASAGFLLSRLINLLVSLLLLYSSLSLRNLCLYSSILSLRNLCFLIVYLFNAVIIMACSAGFGCIVKKINEKNANKIN